MRVFLIMLALSSCATTITTQANLNSLSLGMDKNQVLGVMGAPDSSSATEGSEYLLYRLKRKRSPDETLVCIISDSPCGAQVDDFFVRLAGGVVDAYGRVGDFDSTQIPEATVNINSKRDR